MGAGLGYIGVQIPTLDARMFNLDRAAESHDYCDEIKGICGDAGVEITELSTHLQGQLVAVHPAYDLVLDAFAPAQVRGNPAARTSWAIDQLTKAAVASRNLGLDTTVSFTGSLAFPYLYPWPKRPVGLVEEAFGELAARWKPILDVYEDHGVDIGFEIHPGEDVFDGATYECIFRDIRPPIPTTSAHLYRGIRPALTRCREALVFDISFLAFRHVVEGLSFGRIVRRVRAGRRCAPAGRGWHLRRWVHQ